jgi:hypothetical protein
MTENRIARDKDQPQDKAVKEKSVYQKPAFRYERVFETLALQCGKLGSTNATCQFSRKTS